MYICNALLYHGYSAFSLSIIEFIDITNLSKLDSKKLILEREQYYLDKFGPTEYNILKIAGSSLGSKHKEDSLALMSIAKKGIPLTDEHKINISIANSGENCYLYGKTGKDHPRFGKTHSLETLGKMSLAQTGDKNPKSKKVFI